MTGIGGITAYPQFDRSQVMGAQFGRSIFSRNMNSNTGNVVAGVNRVASVTGRDIGSAPGISRAGTTRLSAPMFGNNTSQEEAGKSWQLRRLVRKLTQTKEEEKQKTFTGRSEDKENDFLSLFGATETKDKEEELVEPKYNYNYKEVANKIKQAKTSVSAEQAVISAKRKVIEVKQKISAGAGNAEELQLALTHATRMEMAARQKKHHLELEEMIVNTQKRDKLLDEQEEVVTDVKNAVIQSGEEKLNKAADGIFEQRQDMIEQAKAEMKEKGEDISDEAMARLNEMIADYGEDELEKLEDAMDQLQLMEIVDPHMSEEDLEELKRKHRLSEQKAIMKADMDYLKGVIKLQMQRMDEAKTPGSGSVTAAGEMTVGGNFGQAPVPAVSAVFGAMAGGSPAYVPSVDIQV